MLHPRPALLALFFSFLSILSAAAQDGLYADFVTSLGNFTCQLAFDKAPKTVANFVALASGSRPWLNVKTGAIEQRPFYDGLTFHRVVSGFVIQGGSPAGDGTDGPGYRTRDEFDPTLRHSKAGILSMAHSGKGTQTNGSQFFVTLAATSFLDDVHSVFGEVTSGLDVVNAIGAVAVDANSKPLTPVIMQSVTIRRVGAAAQAFDPSSYPLPIVKGNAPRIYRETGKTFLSFPWALHSDYQLYSSTNLTTWNKQRLGFSAATLPTNDLEVTGLIGSATQQFYRVPQVVYPTPSLEPVSLVGSTMQYTFSNGQVLTLQFTGANSGSFTLNTPAASGAIQAYSWIREYEVYEARLSCTLEGFSSTQIFDPIFGTATAGIFKYANGTSTAGNFTYTPPLAPSAVLQTANSTETVQTTASTDRVTRKAKRRR